MADTLGFDIQNALLHPEGGLVGIVGEPVDVRVNFLADAPFDGSHFWGIEAALTVDSASALNVTGRLPTALEGDVFSGFNPLSGLNSYGGVGGALSVRATDIFGQQNMNYGRTDITAGTGTAWVMNFNPSDPVQGPINLSATDAALYHGPDGVTVSTVQGAQLKGYWLGGDVAGNGNGIDSSDLQVLANNYGLSGVGYWGGDLNRDGRVRLDDVSILGRNYETQGAMAGMSAQTPQGLMLNVVPEPTSGLALLATLGAVALTRRFGRKAGK